MHSVTHGIDEKDALTFLVIAVMLKTAERIGNTDSEDNGHFGVSGMRKKHILIKKNTVYLTYVGKSGVKHAKSFTDELIARCLKKAIKNSKSNKVFETSDGFRIKNSRVNRILKQEYSITSKDIRGYQANKMVIDKLKKITPEKEESKRKKQFIKIAKSTASKIGHSANMLRNSYLAPELEENWIKHGKISEIKDFKEGGELSGDSSEFDYMGIFQGDEMFSVAKFEKDKVGVGFVDYLHDKGYTLKKITEKEYNAFDGGDELTMDDLKNGNYEKLERGGGLKNHVLKYNGLIVTKSVNPHLIISAFQNEIDYNKVVEYSDIMKEQMLSHDFPPIMGYPSIITENDIGGEFMTLDEITEEDIGKQVWMVTDGHHRTLAAIEAGLPRIDVVLDESTITDEKELEAYRNSMKDGGRIESSKKSNLTPAQQKLVRTKEFKEWFGDWENDPKNASKVVDENGEPMVCYHGSLNKFTIFNTKQNQETWRYPYVFVATSKKVASDFAELHKINDEKPIIYSLFVNMRKPFDIFKNKKHYELLQKLDDGLNVEFEDMSHTFESWMWMETKQASTFIKKHGFDGIYTTEKVDNKIEKNIGVFSSNQVKLADGTNKTFDINNPDIRYDDGGEVNRDLEKNTNFVKITKNEIENVLSGKSQVSNGDVIQAAASYLRGNESTDYEAKSTEYRHNKPKEEEKLRHYITDNSLWVDESILGGDVGQGAEQKVFMLDDEYVVKLNDTFFYNSWIDYFHSLLLHNLFFNDTAYELIGFKQHDGFLCAVVKQHFIKTDSETNLSSVHVFMHDNGFVNIKDNNYYNPELGIILEDLHEGNVLTSKTFLYFVDTVFYVSYNYDKYHKTDSQTEKNDTANNEEFALGGSLDTTKAKKDYGEVIIRDYPLKKQYTFTEIRYNQYGGKPLEEYKNKIGETCSVHINKTKSEQFSYFTIRIGATSHFTGRLFKYKCNPEEVKELIKFYDKQFMKEGGDVKSEEKVNNKGGYDYIGKEEQTAKKFDLLTLPKSIEGTNCSNCSFVKIIDAEKGLGFCTHKEIQLPVTARMCCALWTSKGVSRSWLKEDGGVIGTPTYSTSSYLHDNIGAVYNKSTYQFILVDKKNLSELTIGNIHNKEQADLIIELLKDKPSSEWYNILKNNEYVNYNIKSPAEKEAEIHQETFEKIKAGEIKTSQDLGESLSKDHEKIAVSSGEKAVVSDSGYASTVSDNSYASLKKTGEVAAMKLGGNINPTQIKSHIKDWGDTASSWSELGNYKKVAFTSNPNDKGLQKIVKPFRETDELRPNLTGINFDENGITATDAHKMIVLPYPNKKFNGLWVNGKKSDLKFPNYYAVIPTKTEYANKVNLRKLLSYVNVSVHFTNQTHNIVSFRYAGGIIGFDINLLRDVIEAYLYLGYEYVYFHMSKPSHAVVITPNAKYKLGKDIIMLLMPKMPYTENLGAEDVDLNRSLSAYFDFRDSEIHNADGEVAKSVEKNVTITPEQAKFLKSVLYKSNQAILNFVAIINGDAITSDMSNYNIIKDTGLKDGLYEMTQGELVEAEGDVADFPSTKDVRYKAGVVNCAELLKILEQAVNFENKDKYHSELRGVRFYTKDKRLFLEASNGYIAYRNTLYFEYSLDFDFMVSTKQVISFLEYINDGSVTISIGDENVFFSAKDAELQTRETEGKLPDFDKHLDTDKILELPADLLLEKLSEVKIYKKKYFHPINAITFEGDLKDKGSLDVYFKAIEYVKDKPEVLEKKCLGKISYSYGEKNKGDTVKTSPLKDVTPTTSESLPTGLPLPGNNSDESDKGKNKYNTKNDIKDRFVLIMSVKIGGFAFNYDQLLTVLNTLDNPLLTWHYKTVDGAFVVGLNSDDFIETENELKDAYEALVLLGKTDRKLAIEAKKFKQQHKF